MSETIRNSDPKELVNGQAVSLKETTNNNILAKNFLYVRFVVGDTMLTDFGINLRL
jgi:hypothetical protein